jgi:hypothetical protein
MFRSLLLFGLMSSLIAAGQTAGGQTGGTGGMTTAPPVVVAPAWQGYGNGLVGNSGYVTTGVPIQGPVNPPLLSPPNIALPGSGPATGAPPSMDVNNPTMGGTGDVVFPGVGAVSPALNGAPPEEPGPAGTRGDVARNGILNTGMGKFVGNAEVVIATVTQQPSASLGDVARLYKARRASDHPKDFDNAKLEGRYDSTPQNSAAPQSSNEAPGSNAQAQNQQAPLDRRDLAIVEGELARSRAEAANSNAAGNQNASSSENVTIAQANEPPASNQAGNQASSQSGNAPANTAATAPQAPQSNANAQANTQKKQQLPASASPLPLLALMGLLAAGAGAVYAFRART